MNSGTLLITPFRMALWSAISLLLVLLAVPVLRGETGRGNKQVVHLYFADAAQPYLVAESRVMVYPGNPATFGRRLLQELTQGSINGNLATLPEGTTLRSFFLLEDGTAVVDFTPELKDNHPGGYRQEQLTLFSIVNSLVLNIPEIERVKLLIDGEETPTLAGLLSLGSPVTADMLLTR